MRNFLNKGGEQRVGAEGKSAPGYGDISWPRLRGWRGAVQGCSPGWDGIGQQHREHLLQAVGWWHQPVGCAVLRGGCRMLPMCGPCPLLCCGARALQGSREQGAAGAGFVPPGSSCLSAPRLRHDAVRIRLGRLNVVTAAVTRHVPS